MANWWAKFKRAAFINIVVYIVYFLIWLIFLTCKKRYLGANLQSSACVVLFWHGRLAMMSFAYSHWWAKGRLARVIISDHKDGEIIARVIKFFGIGTIRGSSSKGGAKALINAFKEIKSGNDVIITPDGPRGPAYSIADGAVIIAQKQNVNIQTLNYEASKFWQFKSWDKMILPKPFSTITYTLSEPFSLANLSMDEAKNLISSKMKFA